MVFAKTMQLCRCMSMKKKALGDRAFFAAAPGDVKGKDNLFRPLKLHTKNVLMRKIYE